MIFNISNLFYLFSLSGFVIPVAKVVLRLIGPLVLSVLGGGGAGRVGIFKPRNISVSMQILIKHLTLIFQNN